jgi:hypothetical protein
MPATQVCMGEMLRLRRCACERVSTYKTLYIDTLTHTHTIYIYRYSLSLSLTHCSLTSHHSSQLSVRVFIMRAHTYMHAYTHILCNTAYSKNTCPRVHTHTQRFITRMSVTQLPTFRRI